MGHTMVRTEGDIVSSFDFLIFCQAYRVALDYLLRQGLRYMRRNLDGGEDCRRGRILEL